MIRCVSLIALCLLAACDGGDSVDAAGDVTPSEAKALQEAAEMIPPAPAASPSPAMQE